MTDGDSTFDAVWRRMTESDRRAVRVGLIPLWAAAEMERVHQLGAREIALGFFRCARLDGGMRS